MNVDAGQVGGPVAEHGIQVAGARRGVLGPRRFIPAMPPHRLAGVGGRVIGDHLEALRARARRAQVQPAERQAGRGHVDMAVHESRRHEAAVQVLDVGARELAATDVVAAQPRNDVTADGHGGGVGVSRAVHPAVDQQGPGSGQSRSQAKTTCDRGRGDQSQSGRPGNPPRTGSFGKAGDSKSRTSMTSPSM